MTDRLYADRDVQALGQFYANHVMAMTAEWLHDKSDIAAELAWRDQKINQLLNDLQDITKSGRVLTEIKLIESLKSQLADTKALLIESENQLAESQAKGER